MRLRTGEWVVVAGSALVVVFAGVVGVLIYLKPPPVQFVYLETTASRAGEAVYREQSCLSCHEVFGNGASYGPSLDGVGSRRTGQWIDDYLRAPRAGVSEKPYRVKMPPVTGVDDRQLSALVAYLRALRRVDGRGVVIDPQ